MDKEILVSVCMITYKHEPFLAEAIEGVLMQQGDFQIELIIADDASPDNTHKIVNQFINNHQQGHLIKYFRHSKNLGMMPNFIWALNQCSGKYIALCEGDDYWTDPFKLQKQVTFLEENSSFSAIFHDVNMLSSKGFDNSFIYSGNRNLPKDKDVFYFSDIVKSKWLIPTCSIVFRNGIIKLPDWFKDMPNGDFPLFCFLSVEGDIYLINEIMAVYRMNNFGSAVNNRHVLNRIDILSKNIEFLSRLNEQTGFKYNIPIQQRISDECQSIRERTRMLGTSKFISFYLDAYLTYQKYFKKGDLK